MARKLTIKTTRKPAVTITRTALRSTKLVYLALANKPLKYAYGRSRITYVGTTKRGAHRIAASAAAKAGEILGLHGVSSLEFYVVSCQSRQGVSTWRKLERGLILTFREIHGEIPICNSQGNRIVWTDEDRYFTRKRMRSVIERFS